MSGFLYGQTCYNLLNSTTKLNDYILKAKTQGYTSLSITDPNLYGHIKFYNICLKNNIKPIIGLELTIDDYSFILYPFNNKGYQNLLYISSYIELNTNMTIDILLEHSSDLITILPVNNLDKDNINILIDKFSKFESIGLGINASNITSNAFDSILKLSIDKSIKMYPICKFNCLNNTDTIALNTLAFVSNKPTDVKAVAMIDKEELSTIFSKHSILENYNNLVDKINIDLTVNSNNLPIYPNTSEINSKEYLKTLCHKGLIRRLNNSNDQSMLDTYSTRLSFELNVINNMGYNDYFLIVYDFIKYAKQNDILVGPGRGSASGSLVSYVLGITEVDPIKYDLFFERFLNPDRITMPDIDIDFPDDKRDEVIKYVVNKYNKENVCYISTFVTFQLKSSLRDITKYLNQSKYLDQIINKYNELKSLDLLFEYYIDNNAITSILSAVRVLEDIPRQISTHAAGIIISKDNLFNKVPLKKGLNDIYQSQLEAYDLESLGYLKIDFLGITNLSLIKNTINDIAITDSNITNKFLYNIDLSDKKTLTLLKNADTFGIFQLESEGIKKVLRKLETDNFNDIVAVLALYRPGPMKNIDTYIERKKGSKFEYIHKDIIPILKNTFGIIIYQEQIMSILQKFASYTLAEADLLRRAISKKQEVVLKDERERFVSKAVNNGYTLELSNKIYDYIVEFADYGFNKSHSVSYALISYQMAYLKANYLSYFYANILSSSANSLDTLVPHILYLKKQGIKVIEPSINYSTDKILVYKAKHLILPFISIKTINKHVSNSIIEERSINGVYTSYNDFLNRHKDNKLIDKKIKESLILSGVFNEFNINKKEEILKLDVMNLLLDNLITTEYDQDYLMEKEFELLGYNIKYNIFNLKRNIISEYKFKPLDTLTDTFQTNIIFEILTIKEVKTKTNQLMLFLDIQDETQMIEAVMFSSDYENLNIELTTKTLYYATCSLSLKDNTRKIILKKIITKL
ncbi:MAG: DNA polymerase III subunit alpha [Anaeroplasmataceae bacterium]